MNYYFRQISSFADLTSETHEIDILRNTEDLSIVSANILVGDVLNLTVRNHGSYPSHLCWMGLFDELSNTQEYYSIDFSIDPGDTITDILNSSAMIPDGEERLIQLVTDYGNLLTYQYPGDFIGGNGDNQQSSVFITGMGQPFNPVWYQLQGSTIYNSGSMSDMIRDNQSYFVVNSYAIGGMSNIEDYVDLQSNVDGSPDIGTHNIFSDLTIGPDGILDILQEEDTSSGGPLNPPKYESSEEAGSSGDVTQIQVNKPSGTVQGDLLFAVFSKNSKDGLLSSPAGWTDLGEGSTGKSRVLLSYKIATSSEPATYTFMSTDSDQMCVGVSRFSGVDSNDPIDAYSSIDTGNSNSPTCPTVTTTISNTTILRVMGATDDAYIEPSNYPSGYTGIFTVQSTGASGETHGALAYLTEVNEGSTGIASFSLTGNDQWGAMTVALKPPSSTDIYEIDLEIQWSNVSFTESNEELAIFTQLNRYSFDAQGGYMVIGDGSPSWGSTVGTISYWVKWDSVANRPWGQAENMEFRISGSNLILDWGNTASITSSTTFILDKWYFIAVSWNENTDELTLYVGDDTTPPSVDTYIPTWTDQVSTQGVIENNFLASINGLDPLDGHGDDLRYWDIDRSQAEIQTDYMQVLG
ncbi:MAG: LamG-like jellyroll fold domain-containing protein, partial [Candidatus Thorarchaeota archaeon]